MVEMKTRHHTRTCAPQRRRVRRIAAAGLALLVVAGASFDTEPAAAASDGAVGNEQLFIYELNQARWDPAAFGAATGADMSEGADTFKQQAAVLSRLVGITRMAIGGESA